MSDTTTVDLEPETEIEPESAPEQVPIRCSFCHKSQQEVCKLITTKGSGHYICDECIVICVEMMIRG